MRVISQVFSHIRPLGNDPLWNFPEAKAALMKESNKLIIAGVWEVIAEEKDEVTRKFPDVTFSRLFDILGLKSSEMNKAT
jgi:hypothetical protein